MKTGPNEPRQYQRGRTGDDEDRKNTVLEDPVFISSMFHRITFHLEATKYYKYREEEVWEDLPSTTT